MSIERFSWENKIIVVTVRQVSELKGITQLNAPKIANTVSICIPIIYARD